jgi:hypothetical protein
MHKRHGDRAMRTSYEQMRDLYGQYTLAVAHGELAEALMIREIASKVLVRNWTKILEALRIADVQGIDTTDEFAE